MRIAFQTAFVYFNFNIAIIRMVKCIEFAVCQTYLSSLCRCLVRDVLLKHNALEKYVILITKASRSVRLWRA